MTILVLSGSLRSLGFIWDQIYGWNRRRGFACATPCPSVVKTSGQPLHYFLEHLPAMLVVAKLIEAGAGRSQQHDIAGLAARWPRASRLSPGSRRARSPAAALDLGLDLVRRRADRVNALHPLPQQFVQHGIVAALILAAKN